MLVGEATKPGLYDLTPRIVVEEVYGGSVLKFDETEDSIYSIHRILPGRTLDSDNRRQVTAGCVNVSPDVYEKLLSCCVGKKLLIQE